MAYKLKKFILQNREVIKSARRLKKRIPQKQELFKSARRLKILIPQRQERFKATRKLKTFIPQTPEELSGEWFTNALKESGIITDSEVINFSISEPESGEGFSGVTLRVDLEWNFLEADAPERVLLKFPSNDLKNRALLERDGTYDREFDFYERFSNQFPVRVPKLLFSIREPIPDIESRRKLNKKIEHLPVGASKFFGKHARKLLRPSGRRYALMIEYIDNARTTTTENFASEEDLLQILHSLAQVHAHWWKDPVLSDDDGVAWPTVTHTPKLMNGLYWGSRAQILENNSEIFTSDMVRAADWFGNNAVEAVKFLNEPLALLRGDTRTDNMLFTSEGLVMVDFGSFSSGRPACDVSLLLSSAVEAGPNARDTMESLSDRYYESLLAFGVKDYSKLQFENDMKVGFALQAYLIMLAAGHYEAEYSGGSLVELWARRIGGLISKETPLLVDHVTV